MRQIVACVLGMERRQLVELLGNTSPPTSLPPPARALSREETGFLENETAEGSLRRRLGGSGAAEQRGEEQRGAACLYLGGSGSEGRGWGEDWWGRWGADRKWGL